MEKQQAKGELGEEELKALEMDVTGKVFRFLSVRFSAQCHPSRSCSRPGEVLAWR